jgi:hypothetical protein
VSQVTAAAPPANDSDALDMFLASLRYLTAADPTAMRAEEQARCLKVLEEGQSMATVARALILGAFTAGEGYSADGEYSTRSWLIHRTGISRAAAMAHSAWERRVKEHPKIARAMTMGLLSESWAKAICEVTGKLRTAEDVDKADGILVWAALHGVTLPELLSMATEIYARSLPGGGPDPPPGTAPCGWPPPWTAPASCTVTSRQSARRPPRCWTRCRRRPAPAIPAAGPSGTTTRSRKG